jgi:hypothetical protein
MSKQETPVRWFKVTILRDGQQVIAYEIRASEVDHAVDEAWRRYELAKRVRRRFDSAFDTEIEEL